MSTLGIVIPCYRQERWLPRTLDALRTLPSGFRPSGALVYAGGGAPAQPLVPGPPGWRVVTPPAERRDAAPLTPGAARMAGLAACEGEWVLFADADVEVDALWLARALARIESGADARLAGLWGRIEEWFVDANGRESAGVPDLYGVGEAEHEVDYLATLALYRRAALLEAIRASPPKRTSSSACGCGRAASGCSRSPGAPRATGARRVRASPSCRGAGAPGCVSDRVRCCGSISAARASAA